LWTSTKPWFYEKFALQESDDAEGAFGIYWHLSDKMVSGHAAEGETP